MGIYKRFSDLKINLKLQIAFFSIAFVSISVIGFLSYFKGKNSLEEESFNRLTAVREMKATQIEDYFKDIRNQIITFSEDKMIIEAMSAFKVGFDTIVYELNYSHEKESEVEHRLSTYYRDQFLPRLNENVKNKSSVEDHLPANTASVILQDLYISNNPHNIGEKHFLTDANDGSTYSMTHAQYHPLIRSYLEKFEFYDIFLVDHKTGNIIYTVYKEVDFGTSLTEGPYKNSNIAKVFHEANNTNDKDFVKLVDFEPYHPSYNAPASFIASPIFNGNEKIGVLIFQMPIKKINDIMTNRHEYRC